MNDLLFFAILSVPVISVSWRSLFDRRSHGFYRFFGWEGILWLFVSVYPYWFTDPLSLNQLFSWLILFLSAFFVISGAIALRKYGAQGRGRKDDKLYRFEETTELVDRGIYRYIRHPLYSSLFFLSWGIFLKNPEILLLIVTLLTGIMFVFTALYDEKECIAFFGEKYRDYMRRTKRFVPFIF